MGKESIGYPLLETIFETTRIDQGEIDQFIKTNHAIFKIGHNKELWGTKKNSSKSNESGPRKISYAGGMGQCRFVQIVAGN